MKIRTRLIAGYLTILILLIGEAGLSLYLLKGNLNNLPIIPLVAMGIMAAAAILIAIVQMQYSAKTTKRIIYANKRLTNIATGDLTEPVRITSEDEIGQMGHAFLSIQTNWSALISQIKENALKLATASDQLSAAAKQSSQATQQVATSSQQMAKGAQEQSTNALETANAVKQLAEVIDQLAKGAGEQSAGIQQAVTSINDVSQTMSRVAENTNLAAQNAKQAAESANTGAEKARRTLSGIENIKAATTETAKKLTELDARSVEISKIVAVIDDIAAQTNLLALNAAIEAARAGEQGRGFAVVSDEVRKLAERTASATKEIAELINSVNNSVKEANLVMETGTTAVNEGYDLANEAGQALEQILKASFEVNNQVEQISTKAQQVNIATTELVKVIDNVGSIAEENSAATEEMSARASEVSKSVETVAGIAEENSAATEQVSASAQEMSAQEESIVASSQTMKEMSVALENSISRFKIDTSKKAAAATVK